MKFRARISCKGDYTMSIFNVWHLFSIRSLIFTLICTDTFRPRFQGLATQIDTQIEPCATQCADPGQRQGDRSGSACSYSRWGHLFNSGNLCRQDLFQLYAMYQARIGREERLISHSVYKCPHYSHACFCAFQTGYIRTADT